MFIGRGSRGQKWIDILAHHDAVVVINRWGYGVFPVRAGSVSVWVEMGAVNTDSLRKNL